MISELGLAWLVGFPALFQAGYVAVAGVEVLLLGSAIAITAGVIPAIVVLKRGGRLAVSVAIGCQLLVMALIATISAANGTTITADVSNGLLIGLLPVVSSIALLSITLRVRS
jgi:hypothetical protein